MNTRRAMKSLYWNTVSDQLRKMLVATMGAPELTAFRLAGGTSLSLQLGHRESVDIDLFTDNSYDNIDFNAIDGFFKKHFHYVVTSAGEIAMGTSYFVGANEKEAVKIDLYYSDPFIRPMITRDGIRLATMEDIIAMKLDIISREGRMKDFWDIHELMDHFDIEVMIGFHKEFYPFNHDAELIRNKLTDFNYADDDFEPVCLKGKHWELIKLDFVEWVGAD